MAILISDSFNRTNNTTSLGTTDTGQTWVVVSGTWGIISNQAYAPIPTNPSIAYVDAGISDISVTETITWISNEGFVFRYTDASNHLLVRISSTGLGLFKNVTGTSTSIGNYAFTPTTTTYTLKVVAQGSSITVYLDGTQRITATETFNQTSTKVGMREASSSGRLDDFLVESIGSSSINITSVVADATTTAIAPVVTVQTNINVSSIVANTIASSFTPVVGAVTSIVGVVAVASAQSLPPTVTAQRQVTVSSVTANSNASAMVPVVSIIIPNVSISSIAAMANAAALIPTLTLNALSIVHRISINGNANRISINGEITPTSPAKRVTIGGEV